MHILISLKYIYDTDNSADFMDWEKLGYACTDKIIKRDVWIYPQILILVLMHSLLHSEHIVS